MFMACKSISEYYNAEIGEPPTTAVSTFGWTAGVFIDLATQPGRYRCVISKPACLEGSGYS